MHQSSRALLLLLVIAAAVPGFAAPTITFQAGSVVVAGITAGSSVALVGFGSDIVDGNQRAIADAVVLMDAARTGSVQFDPTGLPYRSVWTAVDLDTGAYTTVTPPGYRPASLPTTAVGVGDDLSRVVVDRAGFDAVVVRRHVGAWKAHSSSDNTARANRAIVTLDALRGVGKTPPGPPKLIPGDLLILCNTDWMEVTVFEVPTPGGSHAQ